MALLATSNLYVADGGNDDNGGAHDPTYGGDYSLANQDSPVAIIDGGSVTGTITSGSPAYFSTNASGRGSTWNGLALNIISGSGVTTGRYTLSNWDGGSDRFQLVSYGGASGTISSGRIGGRLKTVGGAGAAHVGGNTIWNVGETFISSGTSNVPGGRLVLSNAASNRPSALRGCASLPDDGGYGTVTFTGPDTAQYMLTGSNNGWFDRLIVDTAGLGSIGGIANSNSNNYTTRCRFKNHVGAARYALNGNGVFFNHFDTPTTANNSLVCTCNGLMVGNTFICRATGSAAKVCVPSAANTAIGNWVYCTAAHVRAMEIFSTFFIANNSCHGARMQISGALTMARLVINNVVGGISASVRAFDFSDSDPMQMFLMHSNATYGLSGGATAYDPAKVTPSNQLDLPSSPFTDPTSLDFRLANNAGALMLRQSGWQEFLRMSDVISGFPDIGAIQARSGGGSLINSGLIRS